MKDINKSDMIKVKLLYAQDIIKLINNDKSLINYLCDSLGLDFSNFLNILKDIDNTNIGFYDEVYVLANEKVYSNNKFERREI